MYPQIACESSLKRSEQSGMASKVEKPSRKLRKERKNRAKKVRRVACPNCVSLLNFRTGPRYQESQSC